MRFPSSLDSPTHPRRSNGGMPLLLVLVGSPTHLRMLSSITGQPNPPPPPTKKIIGGCVSPQWAAPLASKKTKGGCLSHTEKPHPPPRKKHVSHHWAAPPTPKKQRGIVFPHPWAAPFISKQQALNVYVLQCQPTPSLH